MKKTGIIQKCISYLIKPYSKQKSKASIPVPRSVWTNPYHFVACGFGIGTLPFMPGTLGTLAAIPFYLVLIKFPLWAYIMVTFLMNILGIFLCGKVNQDFGTEDHPAAVWDELAAFLIVMIAVPNHWLYITIGFLLFRFFDILKPWPISWVEKRVHGGLGVMLDDIVAAIFSWMILQLIIYIAF